MTGTLRTRKLALPLPTVCVRRRTLALFLLQISHFILHLVGSFCVDRDDDQYVGCAELDNRDGGAARQGLAPHQVLPFACAPVPLTLDDAPSEDAVLDVEQAQSVRR